MSSDANLTYPPINTLKPVTENLWIVDGPVIRFGMPWPKMPFSTRMTIIRLGGDDLFIHSPTPFTSDLQAEIGGIGTPRWIVGPNRIHYWWIPEWHKAHPGAEVYLAPRIREQAADHIDFDTLILDRAEQMLPILRIWPEAKFVIAIRDPMELLPSLHQRLLYLGDEVVTDFARAWALTDRRRKGLNVPPSCVDQRWLLYDEVGRLGEYVEKFIATVGRERCHIVLFDDLIRDPQSGYARMLKFIGLQADGRTDFSVHRASRGYKIGFLQRLLKRPPKALRGIAAGDQYRQRVRSLDTPRGPSGLTAAILAGRKRLLKWNAATPPPVAIDEALRHDIRNRLSDDVARLSGLIGRDLSHWLADRSSAGNGIRR